MSEYLVDLNGTQAAIRAGYSARAAAVTASQFLRNPKIQGAIDAAMKARAARVELNADQVLGELQRIGMADIRRLFGPDGALLPMSEWPEDVARSVASVEVVEMPGGEGVSGGLVKKIKCWDKPKALELLGKHLKLFTDKVEHSGGVSVAVVDPYAQPKGGS